MYLDFGELHPWLFSCGIVVSSRLEFGSFPWIIESSDVEATLSNFLGATRV